MLGKSVIRANPRDDRERCPNNKLQSAGIRPAETFYEVRKTTEEQAEQNNRHEQRRDN
jgi:hypothetical protein